MTPPATRKPSICTSSFKTERGELKPCGLTRVSDGMGGLTCTRRNEHVMKTKTGYCDNGDCEGTAPRSRSGKGRPTCSWWKRCPCECHATYDKMFMMSDTERVLVNNSKYVPETGHFKMPTIEERVAAVASSMSTPTSPATVVESAAPGITPPVIRRTFAPTPTGRAARGELATWVRHECDVWLIDKPENPCTPVFIAEGIAKTQGFGKPPSVGAVDAVLKRWVAIGFAIMEKKPTRFLGYTDDGLKLGLEGCLLRSKQAKKFEQSKAARGALRPTR